MTTKAKIALFAFAICVPIVLGAVWLGTSALVSFVHLEWRAITDTPIGRAIFGVAAVILTGKLWVFAWDDDE